MDMTESDLQRLIMDAADLAGWLCFHDNDSRRNRAGFPDLVLVRGEELILVELKSEKGRLRPDQERWLDHLGKVRYLSTGVLRPADADDFVARLTRKGN